MELSDKQRQIVEENMKLVFFIVNNKIDINGAPYDDIVQIGMLGLCKATLAFDENKGLNFSTFASRCIINEILMFYRKFNKEVQNLSLEGAIFDYDDENEESEANKLESRLSDKTDFTENLVNKEEFTERMNIVLNFFSGKERTIVLFLLAGYKQREIGEYLGISRSYVSRIESRAIEKLKTIDEFAFERSYFFSIEKEYYNLTIDTRKVKNFNRILAKLFEMANSVKSYFVDFEIVCTEETITIKVPVDQKSFTFLALVFEQIET